MAQKASGRGIKRIIARRKSSQKRYPYVPAKEIITLTWIERF